MPKGIIGGNRMSYLEFKEVENKGKKTKRFLVLNKNNEHLGFIYWRTGWRKYVFNSIQADYDCKCLQEIINFLNELMNERKL